MHGIGQDLADISPQLQQRFLSCVESLLWITSKYLSEFIIQSTGTSDPTPQKLKQPQNIFFRGDLLPDWNGKGLAFHHNWSWHVDSAYP